MSSKRIHPRPDQIAELTRGHVLPLEAISALYMQIIAECLNQEWLALLHTYSGQLPSDEVEISSLMCSRLNTLDDPLWRTLVASVVRDHAVPSYDGSHLKKSPDLSIHLTRRHASFRLELECKVIDHPKRKTIDLYAKQGLARFLKGEYAWATREAFMLAYVWDGSVIADRLTPFLKRHQQSGSDPYHTDQPPTAVNDRTNLALSTHARNFAYPQQDPSSPGPIAIWHLWLAGKAARAS
ncbi:MAG: hypothetical protein H0U67_01365 [Gemmatimonadetes bacterium]|nr:hypothetical protein [Gemmatimonadota bacterium]